MFFIVLYGGVALQSLYQLRIPNLLPRLPSKILHEDFEQENGLPVMPSSDSWICGGLADCDSSCGIISYQIDHIGVHATDKNAYAEDENQSIKQVP